MRRVGVSERQRDQLIAIRRGFNLLQVYRDLFICPSRGRIPTTGGLHITTAGHSFVFFNILNHLYNYMYIKKKTRSNEKFLKHDWFTLSFFFFFLFVYLMYIIFFYSYVFVWS